MMSRYLQAAALALALCFPASALAQDLKINSTSAPSSGGTAQAGAKFRVQYVVANGSATGVGSFYVYYYFCQTTTTPLASCVYLQRDNIGGLTGNSTQSVTSAYDLAVPTSATLGKGYIRFIADYFNYINEVNETNNIAHDEITITKLPDLSSSWYSFPYSGSISTVGALFTGRYRVSNATKISQVNTDFTVKFDYCPTKTATGCILLGTQLVKTNIPSGSSTGYLITPQFTMPLGAQNGTRYIRAFVDSANAVLEGATGETDNNAYGAITGKVRPDLQPAYYAFPYTGSTATIGSQFVGRYRVRNASYTTQSFQAFKVTFYYCPTTTTTTGLCVKLGEKTHLASAPINAGGYSGYTLTPTLTIPSTARNGTRYIRVEVDTDDDVSESSEKNNDYNVGISVKLIKSDLKFGTVSVPNSGSTQQAGSYFTVNYTLINDSANGFDTNFYVRFHYCPATGTALATCTYITGTTIQANFNPKQSRTFTSNSMPLPVSAVYGTGYIRIVADYNTAIPESDETNNVYNGKIDVKTRPDLYLYYVTAPSSGSTKGPGSQFTVKYRAYNNGKTSRLETDFDVYFYYCATKDPSACTFLATQKVTTNLNSGVHAGDRTSPTLTLPKAAKIGSRYIRIFVDAKNAVTESLETNNNFYDPITVTEQLVDLSVTSTTAPSSGSVKAAGASFTAKCAIRAMGSPQTKGFAIDYYYCSDKTTTSCTKLGSSSVTYQFTAGETKEFSSGTLTMPKSAVLGAGYIRFFIDSGNAVGEANETNNNSYASISVTTGPDLSVLASTMPLTGKPSGPGAKFTAQYTIRNTASTSAVTKPFSVGFYYCTSATPSSCTLMQALAVSQKMDSGSTLTITSPTLTVPTGAPAGSGYVRVWLDIKNDVSESNENNNEKYDAVGIAGTPDLIISLLQATVSSQKVDYLAVVCNQGEATKSNINLELYYNRSSAPGCTTTHDYKWTISGGLTKSGCASKTYSRTNVKPGAYLAWVSADADCAIKEKNEANNAKSIAYLIAALPDIGVDMGPDAGMDAGPGDGMGDGLGDGTGDGVKDGTGDGLGDGTGDGVKDGAGDGTKDGTGDGTGDGAKDGTGDAEAGISDKSLPDQTAALDTAAGTDFISSGEAGAGTDSSTATCPPAEGGCDCSLGPNGGSGQGFLFMLGFTLLALLRTVARRRRR